jgi:hypothetical protein
MLSGLSILSRVLAKAQGVNGVREYALGGGGRAPYLIEQARLCRSTVGGDIGRLWCAYHEGCMDYQLVIIY